MKVSVIRPQELDDSQIKNWSAIQQSEPSLANPYFCPNFTLAAAECIEDVFVAVLENDSKEIGYFPFQRKSRFIGGPVGGMLSDYQAVIIKSDVDWDASFLIRECGLSVWDFDHLISSQKPFNQFHQKLSHSPIMDISDGFDAYCQERKKSGAKRVSQFLRKSRKIENELKDFRVEIFEKDLRVLNQVFSWKSEQCQRTGTVDFFNFRWARELVERIFYIREQNFSGLLSAVYHGDNIVAAHMGMRTEKVLHYWFPTYNTEYSKYSPGGILLLHLVKELSKDNIEHIDLGKGDDAYKVSFSNSQVSLAEGSVMIPSFTACRVKIKRQFISYLRSSTILKPAKESYKFIRNVLS